jgi:hypothetical protein
MVTIAGRTAPGVGRRMLLVGAASLLLGGVAGGLVDHTLQSGDARPVLVEPSAPAVTSQATDIEAVRAQNFRPAPRSSR